LPYSRTCQSHRNSLPRSTFSHPDAANLLSDPTWQHLWATYAELRRQAHELVQTNKVDRWRKLMVKLQDEFEADKRFFFATV
jgi:hypothetical protein